MLRAFLLSLLLAPSTALLIGARPGTTIRTHPASPIHRLRMDEAPPPPPTRFGATIDQDGKSNVWAVEPTMKTDADKGAMAFAPVAGVAALALLAIPLLPILFAANPDQVCCLCGALARRELSEALLLPIGLKWCGSSPERAVGVVGTGCVGSYPTIGRSICSHIPGVQSLLCSLPPNS
ncbi:hypothetical protein AB1Y20_004040 [Prymnesium parvum]|uniref:Uncharacterized protein n=1 Tax=Prymnesium parvum TaxID=97485 RepID=A0AB34J6P1_PRYPA